MERKINIAELLKDAPKGTKLYSPLCGEVTLDIVLIDAGLIRTFDKLNREFSFDRYGVYCSPDGECLLFPSENTRTWVDFKPSWKPEHLVFKPYERVLGKLFLSNEAYTKRVWTAQLYSHWDNRTSTHRTTDGHWLYDTDIISYIGNEALLGKEVEG